jgi:hypothetical protein
MKMTYERIVEIILEEIAQVAGVPVPIPKFIKELGEDNYVMMLSPVMSLSTADLSDLFNDLQLNVPSDQVVAKYGLRKKYVHEVGQIKDLIKRFPIIKDDIQRTRVNYNILARRYPDLVATVADSNTPPEDPPPFRPDREKPTGTVNLRGPQKPMPTARPVKKPAGPTKAAVASMENPPPRIRSQQKAQKKYSGTSAEKKLQKRIGEEKTKQIKIKIKEC